MQRQIHKRKGQLFVAGAKKGSGDTQTERGGHEQRIAPTLTAVGTSIAMNLRVRIAQLHFTFVPVDTYCADWHMATPTGGHYGGGKGAGRFQFDILSVDISKNVVSFVCFVALFMAL